MPIQEREAFVYALAVLADLALLGAVLVKIRLQDEHSIKYE